MTGLKDFSTDEASNDVAAPPILWVEGQPASTVNNSARATMAALACWHADVSGLLGATGATSGSLSLSTNQAFVAADFAKAFELAFVVDGANPGPTTLNVDSVGAKPLLRPLGVQLAPSDLVQAVVYRVRWHPTLACFVVVSPNIGRPGAIQAFAFSGAPAGWLPCDGAAVSRASYSALFAAIGVTWGAGDGSSTFNVPDLRGRALFGQDSGAGRLTGAGGLGGALGTTGGAEAVTLTVDQLASHAHGGSTGGAGGHDHGGSVPAAGQHAHGAATGSGGAHNHAASSDLQGVHTHTGNTNTGGSHFHGIHFDRSQGGGTGGTVVNNIFPTANPGNSTGQVDSDGVHGHSFTTDAGGGHAHNVTVVAVGDHAHAITADGTHVHPINAVGDHTHSVSIATTGSGNPHPTMPPGAVVAWAIKA